MAATACDISLFVFSKEPDEISTRITLSEMVTVPALGLPAVPAKKSGRVVAQLPAQVLRLTYSAAATQPPETVQLLIVAL